MSTKRHLPFLLLWLFVACQTVVKEKENTNQVLPSTTPAQIVQIDEALGPLFDEVQLASVFADSKTFVDCTAKFPYDEITRKYEEEKTKPGFDLKAFVLAHFEVPPSISSNFESDTTKTASEHVAALWPVLKRASDEDVQGSTLLPLPQPYIVPGGRFREVYYWDSYFTMLGLVESGEFELVTNMLDNFAHLITTIGHIPNGNRSYYVTRSQPPFFVEMVKLLAAHQGEGVYTRYKEALRSEYDFWMRGSTLELGASEHCVRTDQGIMNRYFDAGNTPRQESFKEDYLQVQAVDGGEKMYKDLRSGAESGWDYSSRWFADGEHIETIETTDIIPVDLNALLYGLEELLVHVFPEDEAFQERLEARMAARKRFLSDKAWNALDGVYEDYHWVDGKKTGIKSLAMVYPLYFNMANQDQADAVATYIADHFLKAGGVVTTLNHTGEQWDAPNGWAPLQWMTIVGLQNYGHDALARIIAERWVALNEKVYENTGKFVEKYNVEDMGLEGGGGEYPVQDGFGWSNGVYLALKAYLEKDGPTTPL